MLRQNCQINIDMSVLYRIPNNRFVFLIILQMVCELNGSSTFKTSKINVSPSSYALLYINILFGRRYLFGGAII